MCSTLQVTGMLFEDASMSNEPTRESDDQERVSRLSSAAPRSDDDVVREYEQRYSGEKPKRREMPRSYSTMRVTDDEKLWAAVAHGSTWITLLGGLLSVGMIVPLSVFVPLVIYFMFRRRSDYVAFHALQAFVLQIIGTIGALALLVIGGIVWGIGMVIALLAMVVLIGFILVPLWGLVGVALGLVSLALPVAMVLYGTLGAIETYNGRDYRYPFIARWVDRQLAGNYLQTV